MPVRRRRSYAAGEAARRRHAWLELLQVSGPFLTLPVVDRVWPAGLPQVAASARTAVRTALVDMLDRGGASRHAAIQTVLCEALDWGQHLRASADLPASLAEPVPEHGLAVAPDLGFWAEDTAAGESDADDDEEHGDGGEGAASPWRLLGMVSEWGAHPLARTVTNGWAASPVERLAVLLRARDVPIGLVTDGRWWALVSAPPGGTTGAAVWDASLWSEEPESLRAFVALLTRARFLAAAPGDRLPDLLEESLGAQEEVTETLGRQVREAVELLLATLDRLDADTGVLDGASDDDLYDGVVTVLMRIVFLLFAEERRLLPSDDATYVAAYSVSRLVEQLEQAEALAGPQALEHRTGAWHRLLAVSRALFAGVAHEDLRMPAYGGTLFDPDRYPWLEGRRSGDLPGARPPAVDDRTVLRLLRAVQYVEVSGERRRLTFRALDVEQIGYVYEGLLELEVRTADDVVLGLQRPREWPSGREPAELPLAQLDTWLSEVPPRLTAHLKARTGRTESVLERGLQRLLEDHERAALRRAVGDLELAKRVLPVAAVLRWDDLGRPAVTLPGRRYVAPSTRRASTGTHYTPRSLAEEVAGHALEALVYRPGPLETADRSAWRIRPSSELLDLRVADIAMGSGAFLVAACRYLADRLVEAWEAEGRPEALLAARARTTGRVSADAEVEQVALEARRLVAEHCLYGVDVNPLAVEMAKLSLWLVTMDRERPFGFLDDRLVAGDSLLGLASLDQLTTLHAHPDGGPSELPYAAGWEDLLARAADLRRQITAHPVANPRDVAYKTSLLLEAGTITADLQVVADAVTGVGLHAAPLPQRRADALFTGLAISVGNADGSYDEALAERVALVQAGRPGAATPRTPLHWPVAFPEVFADTATPGFDAIIGNPPFLGGKKISGAMGDDYLAWLARWEGRGVRGNADLAARFVLRAERLLSRRGQLGYIATNTLVQGDTLEVGLGQAAERGLKVRRGAPSHPWPSASANLEIVNVWASRAPVALDGLRVLAGEEVPAIGADLEPVGRISGRPQRLPENEDLAWQGSIVLGLGFTLTVEDARALEAAEPHNAEVVRPYIIGRDLNQRPDSSASRWIIDFQDWAIEHASRYALAFAIVEAKVRPERQRQARSAYRDRWWRFAEEKPGLYRRLRDASSVIAVAQTSNALMPIVVPAQQVFDQTCIVFAGLDVGELAALSSAAHTCWVMRYGLTMRTDLRYTPSDVFLTLPRPQPTPDLHRLGERLDTERRALMLGRGWGLTRTYNAVHDPAVRDPEVVALRDLHAQIDAAVMSAYGWDLDLEIGHHPTKIGTRWTVSRRARFELLDLLLEENHRRAGLLP
jgi:hypothetical protein